jgi:DNA modification methylase
MKPYFQDEHGTLYNCDVIDALKQMPDESVNLIVTSPPYWGLRDYGVDGQIGLEKDFPVFMERLISVFQECRRILKADGNLYVNMGDSYLQQQGKGFNGNKRLNDGSKSVKVNRFLPPKNLIGQPWRLAFALQDDGWYLREDIIWNKPNPMPESVNDRCTRAHEYIFHFTKSPKYFYDTYAIRTEYAPKTSTAWGCSKGKAADGSGLVKAENFGGLVSKPKDWSRKDKQRGHSRKHAGFNDRWDLMTVEEQRSMGANKRSVWTVSTKPFSEAHFATFPPELIEPIILAGCPEDGLVYDPFMGAGTTAIVAEKHGRKWAGSELNPVYAEIAIRRIKKERGVLFVPTAEGEIEQPTIEDFL